MARGRPKKSNPTNLNDADAADALRRASGKIVQAEEALETARGPLRDAKAVVKATGIDFDIFKLCHSIRVLDDDDKRQARIRKLRLAYDALLGDQTAPDLFGGDLTVSLSPESAQALRDASDRLDDDEDGVPDGDDGALGDDGETAPWEAASDDAPADDPAPIILAADMPEGTGAAYNLGYIAYGLGDDDTDCPYEGDDPRDKLWRAGFQRASREAADEMEGADEDAENQFTPIDLPSGDLDAAYAAAE